MALELPESKVKHLKRLSLGLCGTSALKSESTLVAFIGRSGLAVTTIGARRVIKELIAREEGAKYGKDPFGTYFLKIRRAVESGYRVSTSCVQIKKQLWL